MIEFRLLGPLEGPADLPPGKPRALLARLLLDAERIVSAEVLVEALWEEPTPPSAPKVLQAHISALRKVLGPGAIETRAPGYVLHGRAADLDAFEELAGRARTVADPAERSMLLRRALELWRGEPLAEFAREPFARPAAGRLAELRFDALTRRIDADLQLGHHEQLVAELAALVEAEPLREQPRRQLMLALYRSGRQADALAVYRDGRRRLVEELGIEPGGELQKLERAILRQDPALSLDARPPERGPIVCVGVAPLNVLGRTDRELLVVAIGDDLASAESWLGALRAGAAGARTAAFTSQNVAADAVRLATEQQAELLVVGSVTHALLATAPCDVALVNAVDLPVDGPILVPFGGGRDEWPALELGAWLAAAHGTSLRLLGVEARGDRRDASRLLAGASLALQRFGGVVAETALVAAGPEGVLAERGGAIVASLPHAELDATRAALLERAGVPVLLLHGGLRPSGLAPDRTLTRFSWSLGS